ncbi:unnamed protein product [Clonostachys solani]|uniref:Uncharacterized protein n=1 Tax=Clonostachys solani TaxID=160281 RepID=A0A9N9Z126_9HYPO|nr:unnamed protein product [Clonostachys solani]
MAPLPLTDNSAYDLSQVLEPRNDTDNSGGALQVICAWPVSSQYGPGSRILFYLLIAACVLARKANWIKNACLAAALLLPTIAAVHAIALAALHRDSKHETSSPVNSPTNMMIAAVDMDIYGAFQLCSIGVVVAPITVRLSKTYLYDPGRNVIFAWVGLLLAGLLSLTVTFYRTQTFSCPFDDAGNPLSPDASKFPYDKPPNCSLTCSEKDGPFSPMRGGSAKNIYIIPAPSVFTFGAGTLLSAACCVQAILWLISMADKILEINWKSQSRKVGDQDDRSIDEPISGTNGATKRRMKDVNENVRFFLSMAVVPVFGGAGFAILVVGEVNFFSRQVCYENEPMAAIGQWGSIVGVGLALMGSLYLLLAEDVEDLKGKVKVAEPDRSGNLNTSRDASVTPHPGPQNPDPERLATGNPDGTGDATGTIRCEETDTSVGNAGRQKFAKLMLAFSNSLGTAAHDRLDYSDFHRGSVLNWPEVPGEKFRSNNLRDIKKIYDPPKDQDGNVTPEQRETAESIKKTCPYSAH